MVRVYRKSAVVCSLLLAGLAAGACSSGNDDGGGGNPPTLVATFEGVIGGDNGTESGTFDIDFMSDNTGSGTFHSTGSVAQALNNVLVTANGFTATGGGITVTGTVTGNEMSATYAKASGNGLVAALKKLVGTTYTKFCASHTGSEGDGVYSFVWDPATHKLHGLWTTAGAAFKGIITGEDANAGGAGATMSGEVGTVTILPDVGPPATLGGFYDLGGSTVSGSMGGTSCP